MSNKGSRGGKKVFFFFFVWEGCKEKGGRGNKEEVC